MTVEDDIDYELAIDDVGIYTTTNGLSEVTRHSVSNTTSVITLPEISGLLSIEATSPGTQPFPNGIMKKKTRHYQFSLYTDKGCLSPDFTDEDNLNIQLEAVYNTSYYVASWNVEWTCHDSSYSRPPLTYNLLVTTVHEVILNEVQQC